MRCPDFPECSVDFCVDASETPWASTLAVRWM
jgi:hypothetical protein